MATAPRQTLHLVVGAALLSAVLVCWVGGLGSATPSELLEPSVRERVANLESQAKEVCAALTLHLGFVASSLEFAGTDTLLCSFKSSCWSYRAVCSEVCEVMV